MICGWFKRELGEQINESYLVWFKCHHLINGNFMVLKMEVLYHIRPYYVGIFPYIDLIYIYMVGTSNQSVPEMASDLITWNRILLWFYQNDSFSKAFFGGQILPSRCTAPRWMTQGFIGLKHIHGRDGLDSGTMVGVHS